MTQRFRVSRTAGQQDGRTFAVIDTCDQQDGKGMRRVSFHKTFSEAQKHAKFMNAPVPDGMKRPLGFYIV